MMDAANYIESVRKQFQYYRTLGDRTFVQLEDSELFHRPQSKTNSIAMIVKHIAGNMKSRFTDFLDSDGEKPWRNRETEFDDSIRTRAALLQIWEAGWDCLDQAIDSVTEEDFTRLVYIRNQGHTLPEALNRQMGHYAYHVGQIVWIGTMIKGSDWQSLSIPKGESAQFNSKRFSQQKHRGHFTDGIISEPPAHTE